MKASKSSSKASVFSEASMVSTSFKVQPSSSYTVSRAEMDDTHNALKEYKRSHMRPHEVKTENDTPTSVTNEDVNTNSKARKRGRDEITADYDELSALMEQESAIKRKKMSSVPKVPLSVRNDNTSCNNTKPPQTPTASKKHLMPTSLTRLNSDSSTNSNFTSKVLTPTYNHGGKKFRLSDSCSRTPDIQTTIIDSINNSNTSIQSITCTTPVRADLQKYAAFTNGIKIASKFDLLLRQAAAVDMSFMEYRRGGIQNGFLFKGMKISLDKLTSIVENKTLREFTNKTLGCLLAIAPQLWRVYYALRDRSIRDLENRAKNSLSQSYELIVECSVSNASAGDVSSVKGTEEVTFTALPRITSEVRQREFRLSLIAYIDTHYQQWLSDNKIEDAQDVYWHPDFDLESVPFPSPVAMPLQPSVNRFTPSKMLADDMQSSAKKLEMLREVRRLESLNIAPITTADSCITDEKALQKVIYDPLLQQLDQDVLATIRSTYADKKIIAQINSISAANRVKQDLSRVADMIHFLFDIKKKTALYWKDVIDNLLTTFRST